MNDTVEYYADFAADLVTEGLARARETAGSVYRRTIDYLRTRKRSYEVTFGSHAGKIVLEDLAQFCRAGQAPFDPDQRLTDVLIGRQEVFYRIAQHLNLDPLQLNRLYGGLNLKGEVA